MRKINIAYIIDDDPILVYGVKRMMELCDFCNSLMIFKNGKEGLDKLKSIVSHCKESIPDIILLDVNMPIMDGWQFLDEFEKLDSPKKIVIYVVSSSIDPRDMNRVKNYKSVANYIIKPITVETLERISNDVLNT